MRDHLPFPLFSQEGDEVDGHPAGQQKQEGAGSRAEAAEGLSVLFIGGQGREQEANRQSPQHRLNR